MKTRPQGATNAYARMSNLRPPTSSGRSMYFCTTQCAPGLPHASLPLPCALPATHWETHHVILAGAHCNARHCYSGVHDVALAGQY